MMRRLFTAVVGAAALLVMLADGEARAQATGQPKVAVYNFTDPAGSGEALKLREMITTALINTKKFNVFSRDFTSLEEEKQLRRGKKTGGKAAGPAESVDYSIEGSITASQNGMEQRDTGSDVQKGLRTIGIDIGDFGGCSKQIISVTIDVRIKDLATNKIAYGKSLTRLEEAKCKQSGGLVDVPALLRDIAREVAFEFSTDIYPIKVIDNQPDGSFLLNYGEEFLKIGTFVKVTAPGRDIENDGIITKGVGMAIGRARIMDVNAATALAAMEHGVQVDVPLGSVISIDADQTPSKPPKTSKKKGR